MKKKAICIECGTLLQKDEVALSMKMIGRTITEYYCINCLAGILDCDHDDLVIKIMEFREQGCELFL